MNYYSLYGCALTFISLVIIVGLLMPPLYYELKNPRVDGFRKMTLMLFMVLGLSVIVSLPTVVYQGYRAFGIDIEWLRNVSIVLGSISRPLNIVLLVMIFRYRYKP